MYPHIFSQGQIAGLTVRNRLVMPPMATNYATPDGFVTQRVLEHYEARAAGGVGLIIVEFTCVDFPIGKGEIHQLSIDDDKYLPGLRELSATIKRHGARAIIQIHHAGREGNSGDPSVELVAPSPLRSLKARLPVPRSLTTHEIKEIGRKFVVAAGRAKAAGFDGVELHGAHAYLLGQFLSPLCNQRDDEYGGSLDNRARLLIDIVAGIRELVGRDFPLLVRLSGDEFVSGGITLDETCHVSRLLEKAGVDCIHVSAAGSTSPAPITVGPASAQPGHLLPLAARIKQEVGIPVIGVGRINRPGVAEAALREGKCDFVAVGRALLADPQFPNKAAHGTPELIRPCTACLHCIYTLFNNGSVECSNNPALGREREMSVRPAEVAKRVFVVGGGVAGMEAATVAAGRGHKVTLFERSAQLGGQLLSAAVPPDKGELNLLREFYVACIGKAGVDTRLGVEVDAAAVLTEKPDAVILATGSRPQLPSLQGADGPNVVVAEDILLGKVKAGQRVVVIGGEMVGCETAEHLAAQGKQVTVVRRGARLADNMEPMVRRLLLNKLADLQVATLTGVTYDGITPEGLLLTTGNGERTLLPADTVVMAAGSLSQQALADQLRGRVPVVEVIGDAVKPRRFLDAIREGAAAALKT